MKRQFSVADGHDDRRGQPGGPWTSEEQPCPRRSEEQHHKTVAMCRLLAEMLEDHVIPQLQRFTASPFLQRDVIPADINLKTW